MTKIWKYIQYAYLIIGIAFIVEGILSWSTNKEKAYLSFVFSIFIIFMFFFKRKFRRKIERKNKLNKK